MPSAREGVLNAYPVRPVMGGVVMFPIAKRLVRCYMRGWVLGKERSMSFGRMCFMMLMLQCDWECGHCQRLV